MFFSLVCTCLGCGSNILAGYLKRFKSFNMGRALDFKKQEEQWGAVPKRFITTEDLNLKGWGPHRSHPPAGGRPSLPPAFLLGSLSISVQNPRLTCSFLSLVKDGKKHSELGGSKTSNYVCRMFLSYSGHRLTLFLNMFSSREVFAPWSPQCAYWSSLLS